MVLRDRISTNYMLAVPLSQKSSFTRVRLACSTSGSTRAQRLTRLTSALSSIAISLRGARLPLLVANRCCCCIGPILASREGGTYGGLCVGSTSVPRSSVTRSILLVASAGRFTPATAAVASEAAEALIAWRRVDTGLSDAGAEA
jgi:hypothetical protein